MTSSVAAVHSSIGKYWYLFVIVFACVLVLYCVAFVLEYLKKDDRILQVVRPWRVMSKMIILQAMFYLLYSYIIYAMDFIFQQQFYATQIWSAHDFSFVTGRGWISIMGLIFSLVSMCSIVLGVVTERSMIKDHCFTLCFLHFLIVSLAMLDFPRSGAWWFSIIIGFISLTAITEFISYQLELMPYKSNMAGKESSKTKRRGAAAPPSSSDAVTAPSQRYAHYLTMSDGEHGKARTDNNDAQTRPYLRLHELEMELEDAIEEDDESNRFEGFGGLHIINADNDYGTSRERYVSGHDTTDVSYERQKMNPLII